MTVEKTKSIMIINYQKIRKGVVQKDEALFFDILWI
jgi:hypothetical protein